MAEHRPTDTLLALIQQTLAAAPEGLAPRHLLDRLTELGEDISRPTLNRLLAQGAEEGLWAPQGAGRSVVYTFGQSVPTSPSPATDAAAMSDSFSPDTAGATASRGRKARGSKAAKTPKAPKAKTEVKPANIHDQIRSVVWWVADTLRDKTGLQVDAYQPVTLVLLALKRNLDIQREQQQPGRKVAEILATEMPMLQAGLRDPKDVAQTLNSLMGFWDSTTLSAEKFGLPLMTWKDLMNFRDHDAKGERKEPLVMVLAANPEGHRTPETALFTYTTLATDLKAFILEIVECMVPDLREAFGAIGLHGVMSSNSEHSATLSNETLRFICTESGTGAMARLTDFELNMSAVSIDVFSNTYMDLVGRFAQDSGKRGGEYFTPTPLVVNALRFSPMGKFVRLIHDDPSFVLRIADPAAGSNTFLIKTFDHLQEVARAMDLPEISPRRVAFYAQELKNIQVGLGVFNMFYHGLAARLNPTEDEVYVGRRPDQGGIVSRINGNTISEYINKIGVMAGKIHVIGANPPYGTDDYGISYALTAREKNQDKRWIAGVPTRSEGEWAFLQTIVDLMDAIGWAVVIMPMGVLFRDGGADYRQWLLEKDWIEGIIATPGNQFLTTSIPVCLVLLNKDKAPRDRGGVFFVNASEDFTKEGKFNHWNVERAVQAWEERREEPGYSGFVSLERLRKAPKYTLAVNRWFSPIREKAAVEPGALAEQVESLQVAINTRGAWLAGVLGQAQAAWQQAATQEALDGPNLDASSEAHGAQP